MGIKITGSFDNAIAQLKELAEIADKATRDDKILPILNDAAENAQSRFEGAASDTMEVNPYGMFHEDEPTTVSASKKGKTQFRVEATGEDVLFLEFGAGVKYNNGSYPLPKPKGVVGIGQYGKRQGMKDHWFFRADGTKGKEWVFMTHGNGAYMPMYYCREEVKKEILKRFKLK